MTIAPSSTVPACSAEVSQPTTTKHLLKPSASDELHHTYPLDASAFDKFQRWLSKEDFYKYSHLDLSGIFAVIQRYNTNDTSSRCALDEQLDKWVGCGDDFFFTSCSRLAALTDPRFDKDGSLFQVLERDLNLTWRRVWGKDRKVELLDQMLSYNNDGACCGKILGLEILTWYDKYQRLEHKARFAGSLFQHEGEAWKQDAAAEDFMYLQAAFGKKFDRTVKPAMVS